MDYLTQVKWKKQILKCLKLAIGSSVAICLAHMFHLQYEISAGTITLLTLVTTKWETLRLSVYRVITLLLTILLSWLLYSHISNIWVAYGLFVLMLVLISNAFGWGATISVNSVIGGHFLMSMDFSREFIINECMLVVIGISIAIVLNLFHDNESSRQALNRHMRQVESQMQMILGELAAYLLNQEIQRDVWADIRQQESKLRQYIVDACEYQDNTFFSHPEYYIDYFEMRMQQTNILHNLHYEMKKIRSMPTQAKVISEYISYLKGYVVEVNAPEPQMKRLEELFEGMRQEELPKTREEFESRAILYHILMDLEDFLIFKKRFVEGLSDLQRQIYWKDSKKN